jgi:aspartate aminotransferase-like enzyme
VIKKPYLITPGPTPIPRKVAAAAAEPLIHHRTEEFSEIYMQVTDGLKQIFRTEQDVYVLVSSGTGAMEAAVVNILGPGDPILVVNAGKFGDRWGRIARAYSAEVHEIKLEWGHVCSPEDLAARLAGLPRIKAVFTSLSETSTGSVFDVEGFSRVTREHGALLVVDGISGLGAMPCPMDDWGIDVLISGSQKSFMTPPGLAFISFSPAAWKAVETARLPRFYFDARAARKSLMQGTSPWTPAISLLRQLHTSLAFMLEIGLEGLIAHHRTVGEATRAGIRALGLELLSERPGNILTAVKTPEGLDGSRLVKMMRDKYRVQISGAQVPHTGEFFRIGHLGYIGGFDIITVLSALEMTLEDMGFDVQRGASLSAAQTILKEFWS